MIGSMRDELGVRIKEEVVILGPNMYSYLTVVGKKTSGTQ